MIRKISISELKTGMYVCGLEKDHGGQMLSFMNNMLIKNVEDIKRLERSGYAFACVDLDPAGQRPHTVAAASPALNAAPPETHAAHTADACEEAAQAAFVEEEYLEEKDSASGNRPDRVCFHEELKEAKRVRNEAETIVRGFMDSVRNGKEIETGKVHDAVGRMVDSVLNNQDALTSLARLKSFDDYTFAHSVNVCILSLTLGRHMGLNEAELHDLGVGAVLHDIGKMLVPEPILKKPGPLTDPELTVMKRHTMLGAELLYNTKEITDFSRSVALHHHERFDGSGYQDFLSGGSIHLFARIAAVADVYDAMTSNRVYQKGMRPEAALKKMYTLRGIHFDPELVDRLIKCLGIYPIGALVELNTGETAIVLMPNHSHPLQPHVLMFSDKAKRRVDKPFEVDLKDEIGRWIISSMPPGPLAPIIEELIA